MAGDEGRFGRIGEVRACWCPKGVRPTVPKQQVRQYGERPLLADIQFVGR